MLKNTKKAQALLELAILSAVLIFAIGALVSIGITYNRNQELNMRAHRNAMAMAYNPLFREHTRQVSVTMLEDQPIMDVTGDNRQQALVPYMASAGGVWSNKIYFDYDMVDWDNIDLSSFSSLQEFLQEIAVSYLDLPSTQYLINEQLYYLPTANYTYRFSILDGGWMHEDMYEYLDGGIDYDCVPGGASWVRCWVPAKKIKKGDRLDVDLTDNFKEELIMDKLTLDDVIDELGVSGLVPDFLEDALGSMAVFLVLDDQEGAVDLTKDSIDTKNNDDYYQSHSDEVYESVTQGLQGRYKQDNILEEATLLIEENQDETVNKWTTNSSSELTHYIKYNPGSAMGLVHDALSGTIEGLSEETGSEVSKNIRRNEIVLWSTPRQ
ncbi:MAG: hypothetical protein P9L96_02540 [Candidatus Gygaella obscura]|nr:hypothetical protein [Candidatus Gygaella obscura]